MQHPERMAPQELLYGGLSGSRMESTLTCLEQQRGHPLTPCLMTHTTSHLQLSLWKWLPEVQQSHPASEAGSPVGRHVQAHPWLQGACAAWGGATR